MINQLYNQLDNTIMYGVNKSVHAWNWTTGRTKADFANLMLFGTPILTTTAGIIGNNYPLATFNFVSLTFCNHFMQIINKDYEKKEARALENNAKFSNSLTDAYEFSGPFTTTFAGVMFIPPIRDQDILNAAGFLTQASSFYIMRADYLPPRKSAFRRLNEYLEDKIA